MKDTLGVIIFQEQILLICRELAGFTAGQGDLFRRALGDSRSEIHLIKQLQQAFIEGARRKGVPEPVAEHIFNKLRVFGSYSFPKSHAGAFSVIVYQSAWLKKYHPAAFYIGLLNNQPMGFWSPAVLVNDARRHGIRVLPVDVNASQPKCGLEGEAIRMGLGYVKGIGMHGGKHIANTRGNKPFRSLLDLCQRTRLPKRLFEHLIMAGALDTFKRPRRQMLWELGTLHYQERELNLDYVDWVVDLTDLTPEERLAHEENLVGVSTGDHIMTLYRSKLNKHNIMTSQQLRSCQDKQRVRVAGLVAIHQAPPTAKGFRFITLEDEFGLMDVIVHPKTYERIRHALRESRLLVVEGDVQKQGRIVNVIARRAAGLQHG